MQKLTTGERKSLAMDHVILVPGPKRETECVKAIFQMALQHKTISEIAQTLNARKIPYLGGRKWTIAAVGRTLRHRKYAGCLLWNRTTSKLHTGPINVPAENWIVKPGAFAPMIDQKVFDRVQEILQKRRLKTTKEKMLQSLRKLLKRKGKLTENIIRNAPDAPSVSMCHYRLGRFREVYKLVGYEAPAGSFSRIESRMQTYRVRAEILAQIAELFPGRATFFCLAQRHRHIIRLDNSLNISLLVCRSRQTLWRGIRWILVPALYERDYITLLARMNVQNNGVESFYLFPRIDEQKHRKLSENDAWWNKGKVIELWQLYESAKDILRVQQAS